jgi:hypothetical protein
VQARLNRTALAAIDWHTAVADIPDGFARVFLAMKRRRLSMDNSSLKRTLPSPLHVFPASLGYEEDEDEADYDDDEDEGVVLFRHEHRIFHGSNSPEP